MNQSLTKTQMARAPALQPADQALMVRRLVNAVEQSRGSYSISERNAPTEEQRTALELRRAELLEAFTKQAVAIEKLVARIGRMFLRFPGSSFLDAEQTTKAYALDLLSFPLWAVDLAIASVISENNRDKAPSSPRLQTRCREAMAPYRAELVAISKILDAGVYHVPTQEERDESMARFRETLRALRFSEPFDFGASKGNANDQSPDRPLTTA